MTFKIWDNKLSMWVKSITSILQYPVKTIFELYYNYVRYKMNIINIMHRTDYTKLCDIDRSALSVGWYSRHILYCKANESIHHPDPSSNIHQHMSLSRMQMVLPYIPDIIHTIMVWHENHDGMPCIALAQRFDISLASFSSHNGVFGDLRRFSFRGMPLKCTYFLNVCLFL